MVQEFHVVRCFSCQSFQVQQVKKANRWSCKLCGEKQSLLKEYGRGSGADCRRHVQKLNAIRGAMMEDQEGNTWSLWEQQVEAEEQKQGEDQVTQTQVSRWTKYLDTPEEAELEEEEEPEWNVLMDRQQLHGNNMIDREYSVSKRKRMEEKTEHQEDSCSPDQPTYLKRKPGRPSAINTPPSQRLTSPPSQRGISPPSQRFTSPPSQGFTSPPSQRGISPSSQRFTSPPSQRGISPSSQRFTSPPSQRCISPPSQRFTSPPSQRLTSPPSQRFTSPPSQRLISPPSQRFTSPPSQRGISPPSQRDTSPPGVSSCTASRCARFLSTGCQVQVAKGLSGGGWSQCIGGATAMSRPDLAKPHPQFPVSSMFDSGEDFSFDDDFLTCQRV